MPASTLLLCISGKEWGERAAYGEHRGVRRRIVQALQRAPSGKHLRICLSQQPNQSVSSDNVHVGRQFVGKFGNDGGGFVRLQRRRSF